MDVQCSHCKSSLSRKVREVPVTNKSFIKILDAGAGSVGLFDMPEEVIATDVIYVCEICNKETRITIHDGKPW